MLIGYADSLRRNICLAVVLMGGWVQEIELPGVLEGFIKCCTVATRGTVESVSLPTSSTTVSNDCAMSRRTVLTDLVVRRMTYAQR